MVRAKLLECSTAVLRDLPFVINTNILVPATHAELVVIEGVGTDAVEGHLLRVLLHIQQPVIKYYMLDKT